MSVTIHTSIGDLKLEIFCDTAPRTAFNFLALCANGAYDGTLFHRNIRGFMVRQPCPSRFDFAFALTSMSSSFDNFLLCFFEQIQGGDTAEKTGVKGGESIWGDTSFPDEFHPDNIHDKVSSGQRMAMKPCRHLLLQCRCA